MISSFLNLAFLSGGESGGSPLDVSPGLILWTVVTFIFLLLILSKFAWKPILNSLKERENLIKESLDKAENARKEAERLNAENKTSLLKADDEAHKIIEQGREHAEKLKAQILQESKIHAKKMIENATSEIERKNNEAFNELKDQVGMIAIQAAEKILTENLDKEKHIKIINRYLKDISKK